MKPRRKLYELLLNLSRLPIYFRYHKCLRFLLMTFSFIGSVTTAFCSVKSFYWNLHPRILFFNMQCDLLDMPAVAQLEKDPNNAPVYQLLKIFLTQRLDAYMEFQNANSGFLQTYGTVHIPLLLIIIHKASLVNPQLFSVISHRRCLQVLSRKTV